jgi:beta-galactosidase
MIVDKSKAVITSLRYDDVEMLRQGPVFDVRSAWIDNHTGIAKRGRIRTGFEKSKLNSLEPVESRVILREKSKRLVRFDLKHMVLTPDSTGFTEIQSVTVYPNGWLDVNIWVDKIGLSEDQVLPRLGVRMLLDDTLQEIEFYGHGPHDNYNDRITSALVGRYAMRLEETFWPYYTLPQDHGNKEGVRWIAFRSESGAGFVTVPHELLSAAVLPYTQEELSAAMHPHDLPESSGAEFRLAWKVCGMGNNSCGRPPLDRYIPMFTESVSYGFSIRPLSVKDDAGEIALLRVN